MYMKILVVLSSLWVTSICFADSAKVVVGTPDLRNNDSISSLSIDTSSTSTDTMNAVCGCPSPMSSTDNDDLNNNSVLFE